MTALMSFDKDFFFIIIILGCMLRREKKPFLISKIQQKTPSLLGSIHIQQSCAAFTDWTNYPLLDVSQSMHTVGPTPVQSDANMESCCLMSHKYICVC